MKLLYFNLDTGAGVEFIGTVFLEILSHIDLFSEIYYYTSQDYQSLSKPVSMIDPDIIILNDITTDITLSKIFENYDKDAIVIDILHGTVVKNSRYITIGWNLNFYGSYPVGKIKDYKIQPIRFIHGNIWNNENINPEKQFVYFGRIIKGKFPPFLVEYLKYNNIPVDFYGLKDTNYSFFDDILVYKGMYDIHKLKYHIKKYKYFLMASTTESLSLSLREASLLGIVPIIYDSSGYTFGNIYSKYIYNTQEDFLKAILQLKENKDIKDNIDIYNVAHSLYDFNYTILDIVMSLRSIFKKTVKISKKQLVVPKDITPEIIDFKRESFSYKGNTISWDKVITF